MKHVFFLLLFLVGTAGMPAPAYAKTHRELTYRYSQVWNTMIRFLRVDNGFPVIEKDKKSGYVLFEYTGSGRECRGSVELIPAIKEGRHLIRASLEIAQTPSYVEVFLQDKFVQKLRNEYGDPPPPRRVALPKDEQEPVDTQAVSEEENRSEDQEGPGTSPAPDGNEED
ncbi:MAG: hypothetical protein QNJ97_06275 [Myxococcota bacterium]|nr:hypothetical protein [Myxococcota bacterium]